MRTVIGFAKKFLAAQSVRYLISSCVAFAADYTVTLALNAIFSGATFLSMELAVVIAFAVSSQINFWINRIWVFRSKKSPLPELGGYYSLALVSFTVKTLLLLEPLVRLFSLPIAIAKPIAEVIMFAVNYFVQKKLIFRRRGDAAKSKNP